MSKQNQENTIAKAKAFFERAGQVAETDNFGYAIDMFMEGLRRAPDAVDEGHKPLRHIALIRQGKGGRKPSVVERLKRSGGKTPIEQMLNAEYLLAKDPDNLRYAEAMMKAASQAQCKKTTEWIGDLVFHAYRASDKLSAETFLRLRDFYAAVGLFDKAVAACQYAVSLKPDDAALKDQLRDLSAQLVVQKGKYDRQGDFRDSIKNREEQEKLQAQERIVKTLEYRLSAVAEARQDLEKNPTLPTNIFKLADALSDMAEDEFEDEAMQLLDKAYSDTGDFSFKRHCGEVRLKQLRRQLRQSRAAAESRPGNEQAKTQLAETTRRLAQFELEHFRLCVRNYPTDLRAKFELASALMQNERYDDAIPLFQEARKDPRNSIAAIIKMGLCFFAKGWFEDAADIFRQGIKTHKIEDDELGKELHYNLGRSYEKMGSTNEALELYRRIAQIDFGYKDVRRRVEKLRKPPGQLTSQ